jgi:hypothetical protein
MRIKIPISQTQTRFVDRIAGRWVSGRRQAFGRRVTRRNIAGAPVKKVRFLLGTEMADSQPLHAIDQGRRIGPGARPIQETVD